MTKLDDLTKRIMAFRDDRDWKQFHNPKDCALSLVLESSELMEHFQWKNAQEMENYVQNHQQEIGDEMADILYWLILMGQDFKIDLLKALDQKLTKTELKYPIHKSKGNHLKYNEL